jgi:putative pyrroloquinoline-quinone-binding quinoprotein/beta-propeller uncharacterized protein DUF5122
MPAALASMAAAVVVCAVLALLSVPGASAQPDRPGALILDARSGRVLARVPINEAIASAVPDGRGGWYVGGFFSRIDERPRRALAHLLPSGALDAGWRVSVASSRGNRVSVSALARSGERLYVGGAFGLVGRLHRPGLAAVDVRTRTGAPTFRPGTYIDVQRLAVTRDRLLVARNHSYPVPGVAALDLRTGAVDRSWNPGFKLIGDAGGFNAVVVHRSRVFVAGSFRLSGLPRNGLVALDARTGVPVRRWAPKPPNCPVCRGFAALSGLAVSDERVYVSGFFSRFDGVPRNGVVALDPRTGAVDRRWTSARGSKQILALALAGGRLYLGTMSGLLALDAETGAAVRAPEVPFKTVFLLAPSGRRLLVAGR